MKRIYFAFILVFLFACDKEIKVSEGDWVALDSFDCCEWIELTDLYDVNIVKSRLAWEEAETHFTEVNGEYTDDFGGVFIDENGIFNISVVGNRKPVISDYLIYRQVSNSYNFLENLLDEISEVMEEYTIWEAGVCEVCNKVTIALENEKKIHSLIEYLKRNNLFRRNTLNIFVGENEFS